YCASNPMEPPNKTKNSPQQVAKRLYPDFETRRVRRNHKDHTSAGNRITFSTIRNASATAIKSNSCLTTSIGHSASLRVKLGVINDKKDQAAKHKSK
ncbi:hypothetical protein AAULR_25141, partial [Lacticaseibacillus rhamnosus MTCC 5462]